LPKNSVKAPFQEVTVAPKHARFIMIFLLGWLLAIAGASFVPFRRDMHRASLSCFVFCALLSFPCRSIAHAGGQTQDSQQTSDFDSLARSASSYRDAGQTDQAIEYYGRALRLRPDWAEGWWYVGTLNYAADRYQDAIPALQKLVSIAPQAASAWEFLGLCEFETKDYSNSLAHLQKGIDLGGGSDSELSRVANYHLALLLIQTGQFDEASARIINFFGQGLIPPPAETALGLALLRVPLLPQEIDPSKEALIRSAGGSAESMARGNASEALERIPQLVESHPGVPYLHYAYGLALARSSRSQDAIAQMRDEIRFSPESPLPWIELAKLYRETGNLQKALEASRQAVKLAPDSAAAHHALADTLGVLGEKVQASREFETAQKLAPEKPERELRMIRLYANPAAESASETTPLGSEIAGSASSSASSEFADLTRRAMEAERSGHLEEAVRLYKQGLEMRPSWEQGRWNLAMLYYTSSRFPEAIAALKDWVARHPESGTAWGVLGLCEFAVHDYDNALIHLQRGENLGFGADANAMRTARYHLGILLIRNKEFDQARELLAEEAGGPTLTAEIQFALGLAILRIPVLPDQVEASRVPLVAEAGAVAQLLENSKYDEAYPKLKELLRQYPNTPFLHYVYGTALASFSRYDEAETQFRQEMRVSPESELPVLGLVSVLLQARRPKEALPYAEKAVQLAAGSANAHYLLGRSLLEMDEAQASIPELLKARQLSPQSPEVHFTLARAYAKVKEPEKASEERAIFLQLKTEADRQRMKRKNPTYGGFQKQSQIPSPDEERSP
jgi:tetratricopeptide (TPR) repeat protein